MRWPTIIQSIPSRLYSIYKIQIVTNALHESSTSSNRVFLIRNFQTSSKTNITQSKSSLHQQVDVKTNALQPNVSLPPYVDNKISYAYGRSFKELKYFTLAPLIDNITTREPHSTAAVVYDEGVCKSFEELNSDINKLVIGMVHKLHLQKGDRVGVYSYNNYQFVLIQLACSKLGLVLNPINPSYKVEEFCHVLDQSDVKVLFTPGKNSRQTELNNHWAIVCHKSLKELQAKGSFENLRHIVILDGDMEEKDEPLKEISLHRWRSILGSTNSLDSVSEERVNAVRSDDIYGVYYTSGTTGFPKGATVTQFTVINNVTLAHERLYNQRGPNYQNMRPNICLPLPLFHEFAGVLGILAPFVAGGSFVFPGMRYNIKTVFESILRFKCNAIYLTPTILIDLLAHVKQEKPENFPLKTILIAGSAVMPELVHKAYRTLPDLEEVRIGYGSSENGVLSTLQTNIEPTETRPFTVGPPLDFTEIRIADTSTDQTTMIGESGEVQTRGFNTMLYYLNDPKRTNDAITTSRWYKTGDLGVIDSYGCLRIVGRIKDLIIKGGENVYPAEVERILHAHKFIDDAHVIGVPDKRYGEEVCAWIKLNQPIDEKSQERMKSNIKDFCRDKIAYNKVPKYIIFVDQFPLTPVKKVKKYEMRAKTVELLNLP